MNAFFIKLSLYYSYIQTAIRIFRKNSSTTLINAIGLVLGISGFIFINLYVYNEFSFDRHVKEGDLIYRATFLWKSLADGEDLDIGLSLATLPEELNTSFPDVEAATGLSRLPGRTIVQIDDNVFQEENIFETDASFFDVFQPEISLGGIQNSIDPSSLVLTESLVKKYFGNDDPLQQTVLVNNYPYQVVAVLKDTPPTSSIRYDALIFTFDNYSTDLCYTYFKIHPDADKKNLLTSINEILSEEYGSYFSSVNATGTYELEKLHDIHFGKAKLYDDAKGNKLMLYILITIAVLILVISVVNYLNLNIAQVSGRQTEVGMRKIFGASTGEAVLQYILEFFLIAIFCLIISAVFFILFFSMANEGPILQISLSASEIVFIAVFLVVLLLALSVLAGGYIYLQTKNSPIYNLRQRTGFRGNHLFRKILLGFQFTTSIALIFMALIIMKQIKLMVENVSKLHVNQVMVVDLPNDRDRYTNTEKFYNVLRQTPYIKSFSTVGNNSLPTVTPDFELFSVRVNGQSKIKTYPYVNVDTSYFKLLGIPILKGRNFTEADFENRWDNPIVNEAFVKSQSWADPLDRQITYFGSVESGEGRIIGVVSDFPFRGFQQKNKPMIFYPNRGQSEKLLIHFSSLNTDKIEDIKQKWYSEMKLPLEFRFLDDYFLKTVENEGNLQWLLFTFSIVCLIIAGLGLFGIININLIYHQKEIAIRKVFGARLLGLVVSTWKEYAFLLLISSILSYPVGLISLNKWLQIFPDKVNVSPLLYIKAIAIVALMMILVMIYHAIKMHRSKTIKWLRNE